MSVFVTVGSTSFDEMIQVLCSEKCLNFFQSNGFKQITFQIGTGKIIPSESSQLQIKWFRFKDTISNDIRNASLVIGHAGAGTILESLFEGKPLIVVMNEYLMDNHQRELAEKLASDGYLRYSSCSNLLDTLRDAASDDFTKASFKSQRDIFGGALDLERILGLK